MFYSTITPNILLDLLAIAGWIAAASFAVLIVVGLVIAAILRVGLLALNASEHPPVASMSIDELEQLFDAPSSEERARASHPAGRKLTARQ